MSIQTDTCVLDRMRERHRMPGPANATQNRAIDLTYQTIAAGFVEQGSCL